MAFDDPVVWILIIVVVVVIPVYLLSLLVRFLWKANKFMDEYNNRKNKAQSQKEVVE
ncbi:MAG: hypothetical protein M1587_10275 [Thaumarchaeota archaeon]|nr:hypothetical protein [Nitrososphaerota archaeon]MCL5068226.1 hypothetical protein [Nitrososphaerota archaeon]